MFELGEIETQHVIAGNAWAAELLLFLTAGVAETVGFEECEDRGERCLRAPPGVAVDEIAGGPLRRPAQEPIVAARLCRHPDWHQVGVERVAGVAQRLARPRADYGPQ